MTPRERAEEIRVAWFIQDGEQYAAVIDAIERAIAEAGEASDAVDDLHWKLDREREYSAHLLRQLRLAEAVVAAARKLEKALPDYLATGAEEVDAVMRALTAYDAARGTSGEDTNDKR